MISSVIIVVILLIKKWFVMGVGDSEFETYVLEMFSTKFHFEWCFLNITGIIRA